MSIILSLREIVLIQMKKRGIMSISKLYNIMNDCEEVKNGKEKEFRQTKIGEIINGKSTSVRYIYRMEEVFNLPRGFLANMVDLKGNYKKEIEKREV